MDIMVSIAIAADTSDSLPCQMNPLVCLDACRDLKTRRELFFFYIPFILDYNKS